MKLKRLVTLFGAIIIIFVGGLLYVSRNLSVLPDRSSSIREELNNNNWIHYKDRIGTRDDKIDNEIIEEDNSLKGSVLSGLPDIVYDSNCPLQLDYAPYTQIQMLDMYKDLKFDNPDGGVWKQGWKIEVDEKMWNKQHKLKVFVVPHSHNDPGWVKTFDEYYNTQTRNILNNMLEQLPEDSRRKFIWAEISFFAVWWNELDQEGRETVKRLLKNNQLEIVTGGWVMNDEANSHWLSIVNQLTEGHQWLQRNLNYTPQSSWSIDPFGMSATQPILLKEMGLQNMLIQRTHYSVKKQLASQQQLEFLWRQIWDGNGKTDMFTHMLPFYSYDIPHTCGPDPKICCQFDFKRLPGHGVHCPWKVPPQPITPSNVAYKAEQLLDQYRKKSTLYKTNVLLIPLGDDFRYDHKSEWEVQFKNYQQLFDHLNTNLNLNVHAQFGTLTDYFNALHTEISNSEFPSLSGDFFTYADRDDHYWSGYYTSRPFYKRMDRVLMYYIRAAETILSLSQLSDKAELKNAESKFNGLEKQMTSARLAHSLFQHHDGITGTAKSYVVVDYAEKMLQAIKDCQFVIQQCAYLLLSGPGIDIDWSDTLYYNVDDVRTDHEALPEQYTITIGPELSTKRVVIYNNLAFTRKEVVTFLVSTPFIEVTDFDGNRVKCQVSPVFEYGSSMSNSKYTLTFMATIPPLALIEYVINAVLESETPLETTHAKVKIYNQYADVVAPTGFTSNLEVNPSSTDFTIQNSEVTASFSNLGLLKAIKIGYKTYPVHLDFAKYGVRQSTERSGAYLFLPDREAVPINIESTIIRVIEGPLLSSVSVQIPYVQHTALLYNSSGGDGLGLEIQNIVNIEKTSNFELVMRLSTNIKSSDEFFTDLNGYQILRRKRFKKLPIQANFYPMPTLMFIEDKDVRMSVLTGSPVGCSSLKEGQIEVMLDRKLMQDDNLGLGQGVTDNHPTRHIFKVLLEKKISKCQTTAENHPAGFASLASNVALEILSNPLTKLLRIDDDDSSSDKFHMPARADVGVDYSLPILRSGITVKNKNYFGLVFHRKYLDMCYADKTMITRFPLSTGTVNVTELLPAQSNSKLNEASLSFLLMKSPVDIKGTISVCPMDTKAFLLHR
ncbi:Alpha mannosidase middle domain [Popillia japonica]|uniref:Alpha-mannosidase n=1 Tax=Popillia japonica TaxID=7064 RepID=A0AAW1KNP6_POPJA